MSQTAFERYAPFIQEYIYRKQWTDLRQVQVEACQAIMDTDRHVIIASGTASGKTEAAFFPILTLLSQNPPDSVGILYIGPLKALINDQFERLNELLNDSGIPVWPWHGDISQSVKKKALKVCQGIVQITPESLEALLMSHSGDAYRLFSDLRFVVIDELHALMGADRGLQVMCLIARLERLIGRSPRRIGLSATLNDYRPVMTFLAAGSNRGAMAVGIQSQRRTISLCVENYHVSEDAEQVSAEMQAYYDFIYDNTYRNKCLLFTNSRGSAEEIVAKMKSIAKARHEPDVFFVHHGSVSAALRQEAEHALRDRAGPTVAAATLTLELGIDIGDLDCTLQAGAPYSCASFVQRLGRSGRRTGKSRMMFVNLQRASGDSPFDAMIPWGLIRSIAIIQLYLEERWVEPFIQKPKPFSLLAHQTLSVLMASGELSPAELARSVLPLPPFKDTVTADEYRSLLRYMLQEEYLQRMEDGGIIVGLKGERLTNHYTFYAVFQDENTYHVVSKEGEVGTLTTCPAIGEVFVLAGRTWKVTSVDESGQSIYVVRAPSNKIPSWYGSAGDIHPKVAQRMRQVLGEDTVYPYLQPHAKEALEKARQYAASSGLLSNRVIRDKGNSFYLFPWTGTRELKTISKLLSVGLKESLEVQAVTDHRNYLYISSALDTDVLMEKLCNLNPRIDDPDLILPLDHAPRMDKYDPMVPEALLRTAYLYNQMDVPAALSILRQVGNDNGTLASNS